MKVNFAFCAKEAVIASVLKSTEWNESKMTWKLWKYSFVLVILALAGLVALRSYAVQSDSGTGLSSTVTVARGDIEDIVTAQGKLEPKEYVDVGTQVSGQLKKLYVEIGDNVPKGQLLAEIDPQVYQAKVEADQARLKTLQAQILEQNAQIRLARQQQARNEALFKAKAVSRDALEITQSQLSVAEAQLDALQAQVEEQKSTLEGDQANLGYTKIYAPMDGTVVAQSTKQGQTVNASQSAPTIVQLANLDVMTARAQVAEADVSRLSVGMPVYFTTLGSQRRWNASVRQILPTPETVNDVVLYNVLVDVDNKDKQLMTGMSTQMYFVAGSARNVLALPATALGRRLAKQDDATGQAYQITLANGKTAEKKTVHVGLISRTEAEIRSGLSESDKVSIEQQTTPSGSQQAGGRNNRRGGFGPRL